MALPSEDERAKIVKKVARAYAEENQGRRVQVDPKAHELLIQNLAGLTWADTERLARNAIHVDGAITHSDLPDVMQAKYELLNRGGALQFEYDTARFNDVGGMSRLKTWLQQRRPVFRGDEAAAHLDVPKGILLLGVQGCGKSLAAKATAGVFGVPLLRLDFGTVYNKYHGETERKLRDSLKTSDVMSPCVLWIDEIEKGIAGRGGETGTTQRVLGTFLTWMAERKSQVFVVATANDISELPPELVRKGRFDEIFFVDLPQPEVRTSILAIHLASRDQPLKQLRSQQTDRRDRRILRRRDRAGNRLVPVRGPRETGVARTRAMCSRRSSRPGRCRSSWPNAFRRCGNWAQGRTVSCD